MLPIAPVTASGIHALGDRAHDRDVPEADVVAAHRQRDEIGEAVDAVHLRTARRRYRRSSYRHRGRSRLSTQRTSRAPGWRASTCRPRAGGCRSPARSDGTCCRTGAPRRSRRAPRPSPCRARTRARPRPRRTSRRARRSATAPRPAGAESGSPVGIPRADGVVATDRTLVRADPRGLACEAVAQTPFATPERLARPQLVPGDREAVRRRGARPLQQRVVVAAPRSISIGSSRRSARRSRRRALDELWVEVDVAAGALDERALEHEPQLRDLVVAEPGEDDVAGLERLPARSPRCPGPAAARARRRTAPLPAGASGLRSSISTWKL